jgi:serine/threonine protein phosphatase PrpC
VGGLQVLNDQQGISLVNSGRQGALAVNWRMAAGRQQGRSHLDASVPCQDQVAILTFSDGTLVGALADGAGSAKYSHYGAELLVAHASQLVAAQFEQLFRATNNLGTLRTHLAGDLQRVLHELANVGFDVTDDDRERLGLGTRSEEPVVKCEPRDLAATLLMVALRGDRFIAVHLGDGAIGVEHILKAGTRRMRPLSIPDNGEFVNETKFITDRDAAGSMRIYRGRLNTGTRNVSGFVLMSDGPESSLYKQSTRTMASACSKLLKACRELPSEIMHKQLANTLRDVIALRTHDDCSLVLLARDLETEPERDPSTN